MNVGIQQGDSKVIFLALFSDAFQVLQVEVVFYPGLCPVKACVQFCLELSTLCRRENTGLWTSLKAKDDNTADFCLGHCLTAV